MPGSLSPWPVTAAGSNGHPVWALQDLLRARGHAVAVDGIFGPQTDAAVKAFQTSKGLTANGTVDPTTWKARSSSRSRRARAATRCAGCRRNFSSATGPAMPPKACKSTALSARKPTPRCADFNTPCRSTFPRSRWTASSARSPGRRWSAACCRASGAHGHLPTCLGARAAPGQDVVGATQKPGWNHYPPTAFTISLGSCGGGLQWEKGIPLFGGCGSLLRSSRLCRQPS